MRFEEIYDQHADFVWQTLRRLGVRESDAADAVQEVFVVVFRKLAEFEGRSKVSTWLFSICFNVVRDRQRLARSRLEVLDEAAGVEVSDRSPDASEQAERLEGLALLERALSRMSLEQRAVFVLFELEELKGEEIALALQIPLGTVYSRLRLGREAFRRQVDEVLAEPRAPLARRAAP